jgi:hypothetical protein
LPTPPGPVSVTSRTSGLVTSAATSPMASSRPTSDVEPTGSERGPRTLPGAARAAELTVNRSLSNTARSLRTSRPSSADPLKVR